MAQSLETLRNSIITSMRGRRVGIDRNDFLIHKGHKKAITDIDTGDTGTDVKNYGIVQTLCTGSSQTAQWSMEAPEPGVEVTLINGTSSTGTMQFLTTPNGADILISSVGTTVGVVSLLQGGAAVTLVGLTTARWGVKSIGGLRTTGTVDAVDFTTST